MKWTALIPYVKKSRLNFTLQMLAVLVAFVTSIVFGIFVYTHTYSNAEQTTRGVVSDLVKQYGNRIESGINELERITFNVIINENVLRLLRGNMTPAKTFVTAREVESATAEYSNFRRDIRGIYLYSQDGRTYSSGQSDSLKRSYSIVNQPWFLDANFERAFMVVFQEDDAKFAVPGSVKKASFVKKIYDYASTNQLGFIEIDILMDLFRFASEEGAEADVECDLYAIDSLGNLGYGLEDASGDMAQTLKQISAAIVSDPSAERAWSFQSEGKTLLVSHYKSDYSGMTFFSVRHPGATITSESRILFVLLIGSLCISMLLAGFMGAFAATKIFTPLRRLQNTMQRVSIHHMNERADITSADEVGELANIFNAMVEDLNRQMRVNIELQREKDLLVVERSRCELNALQAQINPHFLYNALEAISMTARMNGDVAAQKMAIALGKLLRASLVREETFVALESELEHVILYADFQSMFFKQGVDIAIDVEPELRSAQVVKLILQPVVENAVKHGYNTNSRARIYICAHMDEAGDLMITVKDDGAGMPREVMEQVNESLVHYRSVSNDQGSIGLANTNKRIRLACDSDECGVRIARSDANGTTVRIMLPKLHGMEGRSECV